MIAVDLFAGLGGFSEAARICGIDVAWAGNHLPLAVQWHATNHPDTEHSCQDLHLQDWRKLPKHDLGLCAPCCQGHTNARGQDKPHHDASRATAWAVTAYLECCRPQFAVIENVPAFRKWKLYPAWIQALQLLGYSLQEVILDAADCGIAQHRVRLFWLLSLQPLAPVAIEPLPHVGVREVLRWDAYNWNPIYRKGRAEKTIARVETGRGQFGDRFCMPYYGSGSGLTGRSLDRPLGTLTTRARWGLVDGDQTRMVHPEEAAAAMSFPADYKLPAKADEAHYLLGNAVPPKQGARIIQALLEAA